MTERKLPARLTPWAQRYSTGLPASLPSVPRRLGSPGDSYDLEAVDGKLWLAPGMETGKVFDLKSVTIYLWVHRWSRYVSGAHLAYGRAPSDAPQGDSALVTRGLTETLSDPSWETDEGAWPDAAFPMEMTTDGQLDGDLSIAGLTSRTEFSPQRAPAVPLSLEGKAIVARFLRWLKTRTPSEEKRAFEQATQGTGTLASPWSRGLVAVPSINGIQSVLLAFVRRHNDLPNRHLKNHALLRDHGVSPTPKSAYLWAREHAPRDAQPRADDEQILPRPEDGGAVAPRKTG